MVMTENIMLSGPDGVGKSTVALALCRYYQSSGLVAEIGYVRFHHYFQKVLNFFGRAMGKSYDEEYEWGKDNYHDYQGLFGGIYISFAFIDHLLFKALFRRRLFEGNRIFILDRYIIDIAADLIVDTGNPDLVFLLFDSFIRNELNNFRSFIIECDFDTVVSRRADILDDKKYSRKMEVYDLIATKYSIVKINTSKTSVGKSVEEITKT